ncbi:MAG: Kelch repeat-containing protein, partial [Actinomycetota bacterium]
MRRRVFRLTAALWVALFVLGACWGGEECPRGASCAAPFGAGQLVSPSSERWKRIADSPEPARQEIAAAVVEGRVWIVGGMDANGRATGAVHVWNEGANNWTPDVPLPVRVHHAMAAELNGKLFVIGGFFDGGEASDRTFILEGGAWKDGPTLRRPRAAGAAVSLRGRIVLVGGVSGREHVEPVEISDGSGWRDGAPIPSPRDHVGAATDGSFVYVAGGRRSGEHFATFDRYDLEKDRWVSL